MVPRTETSSRERTPIWAPNTRPLSCRRLSQAVTATRVDRSNCGQTNAHDDDDPLSATAPSVRINTGDCLDPRRPHGCHECKDTGQHGEAKLCTCLRHGNHLPFSFRPYSSNLRRSTALNCRRWSASGSACRANGQPESRCHQRQQHFRLNPDEEQYCYRIGVSI